VSEVFADTAYWIAFLLPDDRYHSSAMAAVGALQADRRIVTSQMVLSEVLNDFGGRGKYLRGLGVSLVDQLNAHANVTVIPQTDELFGRTLTLYRDRPDKAWSFVDCSSMVICEERGITDLLTSDKHFVQAGFNALLRADE
jgi:predicted nucleic acid-binding protein